MLVGECAQVPTLEHWGAIATKLGVKSLSDATAGKALQTLYKTRMMEQEAKLVAKVEAMRK